MLKLLQLLIFGHSHKWKTTHEQSLYDSFDNQTGILYIQQCETCGKIKHTSVYP